MKAIYFTSLLLILLTACNSKPSKEERKAKKREMFGSWEDKTFINSFFNIKVEFDDNWKLDTIAYRSAMFGGEIFEAKYQLSYNREYPIDITMELDKANPFEKVSLIGKLDESKEGYEMIFDAEEMFVSNYDKRIIAGKVFAHADFMILQERDTSHIHEYYTYENGFYISIICTYNDAKDEKAAMDFISSIKKKK